MKHLMRVIRGSVINMSYMFYDARHFNESISGRNSFFRFNMNAMFEQGTQRSQFHRRTRVSGKPTSWSYD